MAGDSKSHDASASATGYLFQCRYALLVGLKAIPDRPHLELSLEKFDDIAFAEHGDPLELIQTKQHIAKAGNLSDASVDLWNTFLIWSQFVRDDVEAPFRIRFILVTTSVAPNGSAASYLRVRERDEEKAQQILVKAASQSRNKANANAYAAFKSLSADEQLNLLRAVDVLDGSSNIIDTYDDICREVRLAAPREHIEHLVERLEGWWFGGVVKALFSGSAIPVLAIDARLDELREEFRRGALPIDYQDKSPPATVVAALDRRPFVSQLRRITIGEQRIEYAIRDYYRASEQRSKWARENLVVDGELDNYERQLIEAWQPRYMAMVEELPSPCDAHHKVVSGQGLFKWAEMEATFPLRGVGHRFLTHGSFHILANRYVLGWHPDFKSDAESIDDSEEER